MTSGTKALLIAWAIMSIPIAAAVVVTIQENGRPKIQEQVDSK